MSIDLNSLASNIDFLESEPGRNLQKTPLGYADIGARGGIHDLVTPLATLTSVLGFEPDQAECARLEGDPRVTGPWTKFKILPVAIAEEERNSKLILLSYEMNHSLLHPNTDFTHRYNMQSKWEEIGSVALKTSALDTVLSSAQCEDFHCEFIKLDTQGTEHEILRGAESALKSDCVAVVSEVSFAEVYKGQKLFSDIEILLRQYGFTSYGFSAFHTRSKKLLNKFTQTTRERAMYADAVFLRDPLSGANERTKLNMRQVHALFTVSLLLEYFDFAWELAQQTWLKTSTDLESAHIERLITGLSRLLEKETEAQLESLVSDVKISPEKANVLVGGFVDSRRHLCNVDDVLGVSPLPKSRI